MFDSKDPFNNLSDLIEEIGIPKILIVDDEDKNVRLLGTFFNELKKYAINIATNGKVAIEIVETKHFDLILMDVNMPEMDGLSAVKVMRDKGLLNDTTILFLSGEKGLDQILTGLNLGSPDYITKPFHLEELKSKVEYHLRIRLYEKFILRSLNETEGLLNNISESIFCINNVGKIQRPVSEYSKVIFGINIEDEVFCQLKFREFENTKFKNDFEKKILNAFSCSKITWKLTEKTLHKKFLLIRPEEKVLQAKYIPLWTKEEKVEKIMITLEDITQKEKFSKKKSTYYVGQIAKIIGLNPDTLKTWTKRYNLISETKDDKGNFLYSEEHLERFDLYKNLVDRKYKIGKLIKLSDSELKEEAEKLNLKTIDHKSQDENKISKDELKKSLLFILEKKDFSLFSKEISKLRFLYRPNVLALEIFPFLIDEIMNQPFYKDWHISKKQIFKEFFAKSVKEIVHGQNEYTNKTKFKVILGQILPEKNSLNFNLLLILIHSHNVETHYFEDDLLRNKNTINYIEPGLVLLTLEGDTPITMDSLLKSINEIKQNIFTKKGVLVIFNQHKFIKSDELRTKGYTVITQFLQFEEFLKNK